MQVKAVVRWIGFAAGMAALAYFCRAAAQQYASLPPVRWDAAACAALAAAMLMHCGVLLLSGYAWCVLLRACGTPLPIADGLVIFTLAQFARYVPGNIAHYAGRIALGRIRNLPGAAVALTLLIELVWIMAAAVFVAAVCVWAADITLPAGFESAPADVLRRIAPAAALAAPCAGACVIVVWCMKRGGETVGGYAPLLRALPVCFGLFCLSFLLFGGAAQLLAWGVFKSQGGHFALLCAAFAVSWIAGVVTVGAPAGIGVRELVLLAALSPALGAGVAGGLAIALRAAGVAADGFACIAAVAAGKRRRLFSAVARKRDEGGAS